MARSVARANLGRAKNAIRRRPAGAAARSKTSPARPRRAGLALTVLVMLAALGTWLWGERWFRRLAVAALGLVALTIALGAIDDSVAARPGFRLDLVSGVARAPIPWVRGAGQALVRESLKATVSVALKRQWVAARSRESGEPEASLDAAAAGWRNVSLLDADVVPRVFSAYQASPWVEEVAQVAKAYPDRLRVSFRLTRPRLAVRTARGVVLIDGRLIVLPLVFPRASFAAFNADCQPPLRLVTGLAMPPTAGARWDAAAIRSALALDAALSAHHVERFLEVTGIDVSALVGSVSGGAVGSPEAPLTLIARGRDGAHTARILWGRDPEHARLGEASVAVRLAALARICAQDPDLAQHAEIDVRFPE